MLSSIRGGAASAMGASSAVRSRGPSSSVGAAPRARGAAGPAVVVNISQAARDLARSRSAANQTVAPGGGSRGVDMVQPRHLSLPTSKSVVDNLPLSGNKLMEQGTGSLAKPTILTSISKGETLLGRSWTDGPPSTWDQRRPGAQIEKSGEKARVANTLSARLQSGEVVSGQWNDGSYDSMRAARPGKQTDDKAQYVRTARTLIARLAQGEEALEVTPLRHIVRPDGRGNAA